MKGLGVWGKDSGIPPGPWDFAFVVSGANHVAHLEDARRRGIVPYLWIGPHHWTPSEWRTTLPFIEARARATRVRGIGVDLENGWVGEGATITDAQRRSEFTELARELRRIQASGLEVVVTSFPSLPDIEAFTGLSGNVQIYGISARDRLSFARWYAKWTRTFGSRTSLSFAGEPWGLNPWIAGAFLSYLASLPRSSAAVAWYEGRTAPPEYLPQIVAWWRSRAGSGGAALGLAVVAVVAAWRWLRR